MNIGNRDVIEVAHPISNEDTTDGPLSNRLHLGPIGSGKDLVRSDTSRIEFAKRYGLLATDVEMSSVLDSIIGNCRESFILVKGKLMTGFKCKFYTTHFLFLFEKIVLLRRVLVQKFYF